MEVVIKKAVITVKVELENAMNNYVNNKKKL